MPKKRIAIVTGAWSGLGYAFCRELMEERSVDEIWMIARSKERLEEAKKNLASSRVFLRLFPCDITRDYSAFRVALTQEQPCVKYFVNNAGFGNTGAFQIRRAEEHTALVRLNCSALVELDALILPYCTKGSAILHTASVASFLPQPYFAVYAASKAFVLNFSRALREECKEKGIAVTAVCPGPMNTNFFSGSQAQQVEGIKKIGVEDPVKVAKKALRSVKKNRPMSISSLSGYAIYAVARILPQKFILWCEKKLEIWQNSAEE